MAKAKKDTTADAAKVKADHAATGKAVSPTEDPTDHSTTASAIAEQTDPKAAKPGASKVQAKSIDAAAKATEASDDAAKEAEDNSLLGKIKKSELFFITNNALGEKYVGISPQNDPKADAIQKRLSAVAPLGIISPRQGMIIKPKDGDAFALDDSFGPDTTPNDWARVNSPDGKPLFG